MLITRTIPHAHFLNIVIKGLRELIRIFIGIFLRESVNLITKYQFPHLLCIYFSLCTSIPDKISILSITAHKVKFLKKLSAILNDLILLAYFGICFFKSLEQYAPAVMAFYACSLENTFAERALHVYFFALI